jgi:probable F420-dependent oxidoreductase
VDFGRVGIWSGQFRGKDEGASRDAASELDELGFGTLWIPGGAGGDILDVVERSLAATTRLTLATGILNVWMHDAKEVAARHQQLASAYPDRFLLGLGVSHAMLIDNAGGDRTYQHPLSVMVDYLDQLDAATPPVPVAERALAALGPKMLELARDRTAGAHPYLTTPEHTAYARGILGKGPLLAPELKVVLSSEPAEARAIARKGLGMYFQLPNYTNNLRRLGYTEDDLADGGSDRLVDRLVACGGLDKIAERIGEHRAAGADHVCIQVLTDDPAVLPRAEWRELATLIPSIG